MLNSSYGQPPAKPGALRTVFGAIAFVVLVAGAFTFTYLLALLLTQNLETSVSTLIAWMSINSAAAIWAIITRTERN